jgi:GDP-4-dehydro-6-deoxy-D-mannose reductase
MKRAFITGVSGFVGPYLAAELSKGGYDVYGLDRKGSEVKNVRKNFCVDILDGRGLDIAVSEVRPDVVFHLAAQSSVGKSWEHPDLTNNVIVKGTENLLMALSKTCPRARVVVISSAEVYGTQGEALIAETSSLKPSSPYAMARVEQEKLCTKYVSSGMDIIILRSFPHTGPGQSPGFVCSGFAKQVAEVELTGKGTIRVGNLKIKRDFTDVRDTVRAYFLSIEKCNTGEIYNVCSGQRYGLEDILNILTSFSSVKAKVSVDPVLIRPNDIPVLAGNNSKFCTATGWKTSISLRQTLKDMLDYWRKELSAGKPAGLSHR